MSTRHLSINTSDIKIKTNFCQEEPVNSHIIQDDQSISNFNQLFAVEIIPEIDLTNHRKGLSINIIMFVYKSNLN